MNFHSPIADPSRRGREVSVRAAAGFTLVELVVVIAVFCILAMVAIPYYIADVRKGQRADATTSLRDLSNRLERYYSDNNTYATATLGAGVPATDVLASTASKQGYYTLSFASQSATAYVIQATRVSSGPLANDGECGDFTLSSTDVRGVSGTLPWNRCW